MARWSHYGVARYAYSETAVELFPKFWEYDGSKPGVLFAHGANGTSLTALDVADNLQGDGYAFADAGYPVLCGDFGGPYTYGNDDAMHAIDAAYVYLTSTMGAKPGKVILYGISMGGCNVINWAWRNQDKVACIVGIIPLVDLQDFHDRNVLGQAANVEAAYGGSAELTAAYATRNPVNLAPTLAIQQRIWYGAVDPVCPPNTQLAYAQAAGGACTSTSMAAIAHAMGEPPRTPDDVVGWVKSRGL